MKSLILNINRENNWLSSTAVAYLTSGEYSYNTDYIEIGNLPQDVINNFSEVIQYFVELGSGQWIANQVIAENGLTHSIGHYETITTTGENPIYDENNSITGFEPFSFTTEQYVEEYVKPTINLKIFDFLTANPAMHRTAYYNSKDFPESVESGAFFVWDYFKNNY